MLHLTSAANAALDPCYECPPSSGFEISPFKRFDVDERIYSSGVSYQTSSCTRKTTVLETREMPVPTVRRSRPDFTRGTIPKRLYFGIGPALTLRARPRRTIRSLVD